MKTKLLLFLALVSISFVSCDSTRKLESVRDTFIIFRYVDESYKDLIITVDDGTLEDGYINGIRTYPKFRKEEPFYRPQAQNKEEYLEKYSFDICELATEPKVIALHDHYYLYYPYVGIRGNGEHVSVRDGKWEDICNVNPLELPILCDAESIYSEWRGFEGLVLDKLTKKKRDKMTIDDIVNAINKVIDEGKLDKYSHTQDYF